MKIKAIIFDYGQVLTFPQSESSINSMVKLLNTEKEHLIKNYYYHRDLYDSGKINGKEYWKLVLKSMNIINYNENILDELVNYDLESWFVQNSDMWNLALNLRNNYKTALLSNNINELVIKMEKELDLNKYFDKIVFSNRLDFIKPDPRIYQYCLELLGIHPEESIFIDDKSVNVESANKLGINGFIFKNYQGLIEYLKELQVI